MQVKSFLDNNDVEDQRLNLDMISPIWAKRLEQSKLLFPVCLRRLRWYLELKSTSKCVVGEAYGFSSSYVSNCKLCCRIGWKFMFYFMICSYSKLEETKNGFVKHWSEKHHDYYHQQSKCKQDNKIPTYNTYR
ncbi:MAG: hypothetical protein WBZ20_08120 [Nitrososphaeraceae archaeon]